MKLTKEQLYDAVMQIKNYHENHASVGSEDIELTQAEYDALPDTKLSDNKNYFIKDANPGGGSGGGGGNNNIYSTEEQIIGTWIDGKPIYRIVSNKPINFMQATTDTQELIGDVNNFTGNSRWSTISDTGVVIWSQDIGKNYVNICYPIPTGVHVYLTRELTSSNGKLSGFQYWIGTSVGAYDIDIINVPLDDYFIETCIDEIDLTKYSENYKNVYISIVLVVVAYNAVKYTYTSIAFNSMELKPEYSYILKANEQLGIEKVGFMYCSEYTKK